MRYFVTPNFSSKVTRQPAEILHLVSTTLQIIELRDKAKLLSEGLFGVPPQALENNIFVFSSQSQDFRIYATFGNDPDGEYLLLLDFTLQRKIPSVNMDARYRNPKMNQTYNPSLNPTINPTLNPTINPRLNPTINPTLNPTINPRLNPTINPRLNPTINPRLNPTINPRLNPAYSGPFIYSCELQQEGFIVRANDNVELIFDLNNEFTAICIRTNQGVFALFDTNNEWVGFLVTANDEVRLKFNLANEWTGIVV